MATAADDPYEAVKDDLARAIRKRRRDCLPGETAREILSYDTPDQVHLVGIDSLAERIVFYSCCNNEVIFIPIESDGVGDGGPVMGSFEEVVSFDGWIRKMSAYWGWLHPRYR